MDLLYHNFERIRYIDDLSSSKIGKDKWAVMISEKFAKMDKRIPIPQVPFHIKIDEKDEIFMNAKHTDLMLIGLFQELDEELYVALNFKNNEFRKMFKHKTQNQELVK